MIGIRADANETIATGHIMRCITIGKELQKKGEEVLFFLADEYGVEMLTQNQMRYEVLHTDWKDKEGELPVFLEALTKWPCEKLLVDSYEATADYLKALGEGHQLIYIDDLFAEKYPVDLLINYNAYYTNFSYKETYGNGTKLLLGAEYVPLREEFSEEDKDAPREKGSILLSCGGGDIYETLSGILKLAVQKEGLQKARFHVIVGRFQKNKEALLALEQQYSNVHLHENVTQMAAFMRHCEIAVSAAGTMLYELCAMQVPTIFFVCADNQKYDSDFFEAGERMWFAGDIRPNREACIEDICYKMEALLQDSKLREEMKQRLKRVTDGQGARRIAEAILSL